MKKLSLLLFVVCFMVVTLCGCNCESDDSKNKKTVESIYQENVTQNVDGTESSVDKDDEKSQKQNDKSSAGTDKADDSAVIGQYPTTNNHSDKKSEKNSTSSSSSKPSNEVYEAEIDFSELE